MRVSTRSTAGNGKHAGKATARKAAAFLVAALVLLAGCSQSSGAGNVVGQGFVSGDGSVQQWDAGNRKDPVVIAGKDFAGKAVSTADWSGDVVVVNTWYAGCAPCRAEAPDLVKMANARAADGVKVLGINTQDDAGAAQAFERTFSTPYPSIQDTSGAVIAKLSGVVPLQAVPTTVVLDKDHRVAARIIGQLVPGTLDAILDDVLAGK